MKRFLSTLTVFLPAAVLYLAGGLEFLERRWMDIRFEIAERPAVSDVVLVDIDPRSLQTLDRWPWPRGYHATVLEQLLDAGARRVGLDVDFSSRSIPEEDRQLAEAIEAADGRVVLPLFQQWQRTSDGAYLSSLQPLAEFRANATLGSINVVPASDGLVRRYAALQETSQQLYPSFAVALAGTVDTPTRDFYIDYGVDVESIPRISYVDVLVGEFDQKLIRNRTVIVGSTSVELGDQIAVPISASMPGPLLQALAYESVTQHRALGRTGPVVVLFGLFLVALLLGPVYESATWRQGLSLTVVLVGLAVAVTIAVQQRLPLIVDTAPSWLVLLGLYGHSLVRQIDQQNVRLLVQRITLNRTEDLMRHVVEKSFDAIVTVGSDNLVETFNPTAQRMFGYGEAEITGNGVGCLFPTAEPGQSGNPLTHASGRPVECSAVRRDGTRFPVELIATEIHTAESGKRVAFLRDITERRSQQRKLEHQATHDPLTNLPNRTLLGERARQALDRHAEQERGLAILLLDLDRFKEINDALGHHVGDLLLQKVARRLECPLEDQAFLARLGGDEFAILLPDCDEERARETARRLVEVLRAPFLIDALSLNVDTSIGIAMFPGHAEDAQTLLRHADVAMYVAKRKRIAVATYDPADDSNNLRHLTLHADLRRAIEHNELGLLFQPKLDLHSRRIVGAEALVRWHHPEHGPIPPEEFISLAEHGGLIEPLTRWVCATALAQCAEWARQGTPLNLAVNLSARNLVEEDLPQTLRNLLATWNVPARRMTLEITESVIMEDPLRAMRVVTRLRELGLSISIDDFGTGYSSLGYLGKLPAQELKIDKSFVMQMDSDPSNGMIVHSTIELAHNLGLKVVAEGVETQEVWGVLKDLGCDFGQGYYFSRPITSEQLMALVRAERLDAALALSTERQDALADVPQAARVPC